MSKEAYNHYKNCLKKCENKTIFKCVNNVKKERKYPDGSVVLVTDYSDALNYKVYNIPLIDYDPNTLACFFASEMSLNEETKKIFDSMIYKQVTSNGVVQMYHKVFHFCTYKRNNDPNTNHEDLKKLKEQTNKLWAYLCDEKNFF
jgi:hypothetical protein